MKTIERTRRFPREQPIDCKSWVSFTILESTYRYWRIRFEQSANVEFDTSSAETVEFEQPERP